MAARPEETELCAPALCTSDKGNHLLHAVLQQKQNATPSAIRLEGGWVPPYYLSNTPESAIYSVSFGSRIQLGTCQNKIATEHAKKSIA